MPGASRSVGGNANGLFTSIDQTQAREAPRFHFSAQQPCPRPGQARYEAGGELRQRRRAYKYGSRFLGIARCERVAGGAVGAGAPEISSPDSRDYRGLDPDASDQAAGRMSGAGRLFGTKVMPGG